MRDFFEEMYRFRLTPAQSKDVEDAFAGLPDRIALRQAVRAVYDQRLPFSDSVRPFLRAPEAVPWRYTLMVDDPRLRRAMIGALLKESVRVSAWYPPIHALFGDTGDYPCADRFARRVLNIAPDGGLEEARRIADIICRVVEHPNLDSRQRD